jgi:hypothetical protein
MAGEMGGGTDGCAPSKASSGEGEGGVGVRGVGARRHRAWARAWRPLCCAWAAVWVWVRVEGGGRRGWMVLRRLIEFMRNKI